MTGKTHVVIGTATMLAITAKYYNGLPLMDANIQPAFGLLTVALSSYGPDIDIPQSKLGHKFKFISKHLTHRGITHTWLMPAVFLFLAMSVKSLPILPSLLFGAFIGWTAHIIADFFNRKGVPVLWPLSVNKFHIASFRTGTWHEIVFIILWLGGLIAWYLKF